MFRPINRRSLLGHAAAATSIAALSQPFLGVPALAGYAVAPAKRRAVSTLAASDPIITGYRTAVAAMRALPSTDACSWAAQAAIHASTGFGPAGPCQHGTFFWAWHRMYLYWFERIVRHKSGMYDWGAALLGLRLGNHPVDPGATANSGRVPRHDQFALRRDPQCRVEYRWLAVDGDHGDRRGLHSDSLYERAEFVPGHAAQRRPHIGLRRHVRVRHRRPRSHFLVASLQYRPVVESLARKGRRQSRSAERQHLEKHGVQILR